MTWVDLTLLLIMAFVLYWLGAKVFLRQQKIYKGIDWDFTPDNALSIDTSPLLRQASAPNPEDAPYYLVFDTETVALLPPGTRPQEAKFVEACPEVVCLTWQLLNEHGQLLRTEQAILHRKDVQITQEAEDYHGISTQQMIYNGQEPVSVYAHFLADVVQVSFLVAHSAQFHRAVVQADLVRLGLAPTPFIDKNFYCTMQLGQKHLYSLGQWPYDQSISLPTLYAMLYLGRSHQKIVYRSKGMRDVVLASFCLSFLLRNHRPSFTQ